MDNDSKIISAGELNKFVYCPYQWYYQRLYGNKKLRELVKIRNERYGYENSDLSNFNRGTRFHNKYHLAYKLKKVLMFVFWMIVLVSITYIIYRVMGYEL